MLDPNFNKTCDPYLKIVLISDLYRHVGLIVFVYGIKVSLTTFEVCVFFANDFTEHMCHIILF